MKLKCDFEMVEIDGKNLMVPVDGSEFKGFLHLNEVSADIFELLKKETSEDGLVEEMLKIYNASEEDIRRNVAKVIEMLRDEDLLIE